MSSMPQSLGADYSSSISNTGMTQELEDLSFGRTASNENLPGWQNEYHPDQDKSSGEEEDEMKPEDETKPRTSRKASQQAIGH